ncbi:hypothetical protein [Streptomyces sp. NBC_01314]|uniref:hypothetical protein n=1 Tax=Streptomyces sp. NBC_01314 TaxID=2903821 RepID=UPI00308E44D0|nr:hypothetical protein OG622_02335 [Streptomyces sp. NBC_01314]
MAAAVAVCATACMNLFWRTVQPAVFAAGMFTGTLIYGRIGIVSAAVVRSELTGEFLTILIRKPLRCPESWARSIHVTSPVRPR